MITRWEAALLMALCLAFLAVNLTTATRYPTPWVDEVQFTDPAAHLALGRGFTSTVWIAQTSTEFWAGNAPLYSVLLSGWIRLFGLSPLAVRSFNYFLTVSLAILLWLWMVRGTVVRSPAWRLVVVALVFCGHGLMFSFRMGRYDVLGMLMAVLAALAWPSSLWPLFGAAVLMPLAGLQLIPGSLVFLFVLLLFQRRRAFRPAIVVISGVLCGVAILYVLYRANGVWEGFRASTRAVGVIGHSLPAKLAGLPHIYVADKSCFLLAAAAILLACVVGNKRALSGPLGFGLTLMVVLPAALQVAGKFPTYYNWMVYLPLAIGVASAGAQEWKNSSTICPRGSRASAGFGGSGGLAGESGGPNSQFGRPGSASGRHLCPGAPALFRRGSSGLSLLLFRHEVHDSVLCADLPRHHAGTAKAVADGATAAPGTI